MLSAPAHMPAIRVASFGAGLAAPDLILGAAMWTFSPTARASPVCSASVITGTSPAHDTRLSSSNTADSAANLCDTCTGSAFLELVRLLRENTNHPSSEGTFLIPTPATTPIHRWIEADMDGGLSSGHAEMALISCAGQGFSCSSRGCTWTPAGSRGQGWGREAPPRRGSALTAAEDDVTCCGYGGNREMGRTVRGSESRSACRFTTRGQG